MMNREQAESSEPVVVDAAPARGVVPADAERARNAIGNVTLRNVRKVYADGGTAIHDFDLEIAAGDFVSILGPSGCGKTTLLRCLAGLEQVTSGEIAIDGRVVGSAKVNVEPSKRDLGMVFQSYALWPHMTIADNVAYPLRRRKVGKAEIAQRVADALDEVGIKQKGDSYPHQLSGGQQQRVALARALVARPSVILFDEPLSNLDARLRDSMRLTIRDLARSAGFTAVYVTHDRMEAMVMSDSIVLMRDGRIEQVGRPHDLYRSPRSVFAAKFLGDVNCWSSCTVAHVTGDRATVALPSGGELTARLSSGSGIVPGDRVDVLVRVGDLTIGPASGERTNGLPCTVEDAIFAGESWRYVGWIGTGRSRLDFEALSLKAAFSSRETPLTASVLPEDVMLLPAENQ